MVVLIAGFLVSVRTELYRRFRRSWEQLADQIEPAIGGHGNSRLVAFRNADILLQMIDYACQAEKPIDAALAEAMRREAYQVRLGTIWASAPWA